FNDINDPRNFINNHIVIFQETLSSKMTDIAVKLMAVTMDFPSAMSSSNAARFVPKGDIVVTGSAKSRCDVPSSTRLTSVSSGTTMR
ncbi:hypothetical protein N9381_12715, partial [Paracoccaceae bacterium]|nr:hypothetical protein [Paracoccaceae bacterium]